MTTDESKQAGPSESGPSTSLGAGLGFSSLSMNEIAPAITADPSETGTRTGKTWLLVIGVVAAVTALGWIFHNAVDTPPSGQVQQQVQQSIAAEPYGQDGTVQGVSFLSGNKVRVDFSATISTFDQGGRDRIRAATQGVMKKLIAALPDRDLFITGLQKEQVVAEARYLHRSTLVTSTGEKVPDISIHVQNDPEGGIGGSMGGRMSGAGK